MKTLVIRSFGLAVLAAVITFAARGQQASPAPKAQAIRVVIVSLQDRKLALIEDGQVKKVYTVAVGKPSTPSPEGSFTIERRVMNPTYHHGDRVVAPGPMNPVGSRWMGLSKAGYGIHGTNEPHSIGKAASHGCIRMAKGDLEEFYVLVSVGDRVQIIGQPDEQTAKLFAAPLTAPAAAENKTDTVLAKAEPSASQGNLQGNLQGISQGILENRAVQNPTGGTR